MVPEVRLGQRIFGIGMSASSCYFCLDLLYLLVIFPQTIVQLVVSHGLARLHRPFTSVAPGSAGLQCHPNLTGPQATVYSPVNQSHYAL